MLSSMVVATCSVINPLYGDEQIGFDGIGSNDSMANGPCIILQCSVMTQLRHGEENAVITTTAVTPILSVYSRNTIKQLGINITCSYTHTVTIDTM